MLNAPTILIDGEWQDGDAHKEVHNPVDDTVVGKVAYGGADLAVAAADAAAAAFPAWADTPARKRADLLLQAAALR